MIDNAARARLERWKQSLLDPSDPLVDVSGHGIPIGVDPIRIVFTLASGATFGFETGTQQALETGRLRAPIVHAELDRRLLALWRASRDAIADGEPVLYLAAGLLTWFDSAGFKRTAPLALWPVELRRQDGAVLLAASPERTPRINMALVDALQREHEVVIASGEELDLAALLCAAEDAAADREGWCVERTVRLGTFSFARIDLLRELETNADFVLAGAPVGWLAQAATPPQLPSETGNVLAPLEADASQLAAIAAAGAGGSFVLHGPPGTGKSQTIANLVAHCTSQGKTVLVVSDRGSALDVVLQRLSSIGVGDFCLPLFGAHATRAKAVAALSRVIERAYRSTAGASGDDARLGALRDSLDAYVRALHRVGPLGLSAHDALGRLVELRTSPRAMLAEADAASLDHPTFEKRKKAVEALGAVGAAVEPVAMNPWRISSLATLAEDGSDGATRALDEASTVIAALTDAIAELGRAVRGFVTKTPDQLRALGALAELAAVTPRPGVELLLNARSGRGEDYSERIALVRARGGGVIEIPRDPTAFLALAQRHRLLALEVDDRFTDAVESLDAAELWSQLKKWTASVAPLRFVALRKARAEVRAVAQPLQLETDDAMITALEAVIAERACRSALLAAAEPARRWFGELGGDPLSLDLVKIEAAVSWSTDLRRAFEAASVAGSDQSRQAAWRALVAQVAASPAEPRELAAFRAPSVFGKLAEAVTRWQRALADLALATGIPEARLGAGGEHLVVLREQVETLRGAIAGFAPWVKYFAARKEAILAGVGAAVVALDRGDLAASELAVAWERATLLAWLAAEIGASPVLSRFDGTAHHALTGSFAGLDRGALALARARVTSKLGERVPRNAKEALAAELAVLAGEAKTAVARPLRAVLADLPTLLPRIAPCVLATPQAVVQHLAPSLPLFDLVVFDEASRLATSHAAPALARAKAVVIVGDEHQLLPDSGDSLLVDALATRLPELSLGAHYRSRHEDLFALANRRYYADRLALLPAAERTPELGVSLKLVEGVAGVPDTRANRNEAEAIVAELRERLPSQRSFAVVALSRAQQQLIEDALGDHPMFDDVLVGTPERVMGEERDVVLLSIGGAPEALALAGAERWLAVAMTRAREQLIVFSSFGPEDAPEGAHELAALLAFAKQGGGAGKSLDETAAASAITAAIARALAERGWIVKHQVGCGPYTIDLAVVDPNEPERLILAIEHDGASYANAASARDRDRLRPQLLGQLGWRVHRIWALDWWLDAEREIQRAHGAIVAALAASRRKRASAPVRIARGTTEPAMPALAVEGTPPGGITLEAAPKATPSNGVKVAAGSAPVKLQRGSIPIGPYAAASVPAGRRAPEDMFLARYAGELGKLVEQVLAAEAPVHVAVLARRVGAYFGVGKPGERVIEQVKLALDGRGRCDEEGFVWRLDQDPSLMFVVRVAGQSASARREISEVPLTEVAAAARIVVERGQSVMAPDLVRDAARLLGFARITDKVSERVALGVELATSRGLITIDDGRARLD